MDRIYDSDGTAIYPSRSVAAKLRVGRNTLLQRLRDRSILGRDNLPVKHDRRLYRAHVSCDGRVATYYTSEGIDYIRDYVEDLPVKKIERYKEVPLDMELIELLNK